jgi:hypothetical protein
VQNEACGSAIGAGFKVICESVTLAKNVFSPSAKQFELRQAGRIAGPILRKLREALCEQAVAVSV